MANNTFFLSWQLWLQLTFCLASAIFLTFLAGLVKLFFKNKLLRKHTILDEEKRARQQEMQSTGLPLPRKLDIPFGVRAIQSGVEVDGIWVSRPNTPADSDAASRAPSIANAEPKGKERASTARAPTRQPTNKSVESQASPRPSPRVKPVTSQTGELAPPVGVRMPSTGSPATYKPRQSSRSKARQVNHSETSSDALNQLEGSRTKPPRLDTYIPSTSNMRSPHISSLYSAPPGRRGSSSSDDDNTQSHSARAPSGHRNNVDAPSRKRSPFEDPDSDSASPTMDFLEDGGYFPTVEPSQRNPFDAADYERQAEAERQNMPTRQHKYNGSVESARGRRSSQSGTAHANIQTRRVNAGFEVLPAGTFTRTNSEMDLEAQAPRASARLQKKARD
ncbi:hypothetical protein MN608_03470 [Microdochium nivale]|nr:hypothetical protein MN608_03470 [Microdochium nivale]